MWPSGDFMQSYWRAHEVITKFRTELVVEVTEVSVRPLGSP